jgi:hypothetical protein
VAKKPPKTSARPADKRAQARQRAAEVRAAAARRERKSKIIFRSSLAAIGAVVVGGIAWAVAANVGSSGSKASGPLPTPVSYGSSTAVPPWPLPADASAAAKAAGLKVSAMEGSVNHFHAHLDVIVDGKAVPVPADLGIDQTAQAMSELHTHDGSGVLHIEAPARSRYILGQVFNEWGVQLGPDGIGGLKTGGGKTLTAYVDGKPVPGNPASIELTGHREIALVYGDKSATASVKVPKSYKFPSGE